MFLVLYFSTFFCTSLMLVCPGLSVQLKNKVYFVLQLLGKGGFSVVFKVLDKGFFRSLFPPQLLSLPCSLFFLSFCSVALFLRSFLTVVALSLSSSLLFPFLPHTNTDSNIYALKLIKLEDNRDVIYSEIEVLSKFKGASEVIQLIDYKEDTHESVIMLVPICFVSFLLWWRSFALFFRTLLLCRHVCCRFFLSSFLLLRCVLTHVVPALVHPCTFPSRLYVSLFPACNSVASFFFSYIWLSCLRLAKWTSARCCAHTSAPTAKQCWLAWVAKGNATK